MDQDRQVEILRALINWMEIGTIEQSAIGAKRRHENSREIGVLLSPMRYFLHGGAQIAHGRDCHPTQPPLGSGAIMAHITVVRLVQSAFKADIPQRAVTGGVAGK